MRNSKIYEAFKPKADLLMKYQLCKAYLNDNGSIVHMVESILSKKFFDLTDKEKAYIRDCHGRSNAVVEIPRHDFKANVNDILGEFIEKNFDVMVSEVLSRKSTYPLTFRDIIERNLD